MVGSGPNREAALDQYRRAAPGYDRHMRRLARVQRAAGDRFELSAGGTVLDVACGTGLNFAALRAKVGASGWVLGIELSPEMGALARARISAHAWANVSVIESAAEDARLDLLADGAFFSFTHDVLQSPRAVSNVVAHLKLGASVVSAGAKLAGRWQPLTNLVVRRMARPFITTLDGLDRPWRELERYTDGMEIRSLALGGAYVAAGRIVRRPGG